jgi:nucleotide-binding universal stress UspA family protein
MFSQFLVATDGPEHAERAVEHALRLARAPDARATAVIVIPPWAKVAGHDAVWYPKAHYMEHAHVSAEKQLDMARRAGRENAVPIETVGVVEHEQLHSGILETAQARGCDLVVMGSHGRSGPQAMLPGSVTNKVLTYAHIPVLVCH